MQLRKLFQRSIGIGCHNVIAGRGASRQHGGRGVLGEPSYDALRATCASKTEGLKTYYGSG